MGGGGEGAGDEWRREVKNAGAHMGVGTDEYGGTGGLVRVEDSLEEIFGEIEDEHDRQQDMIQQVGAHAYVVDARALLEDLSEAIEFPIVDDEVETVGGWVMRIAGRIPGQGERIKHEGLRVTVLASGENRVSKIRLDILPVARAARDDVSPAQE